MKTGRNTKVQTWRGDEMDMQTDRPVKRRVFDESMLQRVAEMQTSISIAVLIRITLAVLPYCRMAMYKYGGKQVMKQ
jgi:hypothetical protein